MAIKKFSPLLAENPLCGIGEYKDVLDLSTGGVTRQIKKLVLTGEETGWNQAVPSGRNIFYLDTIIPDYLRSNDITLLCSHYRAIAGVTAASRVGEGETSLYKAGYENQRLYFGDNNYSVVGDFKSYLAAQYANGTPVTIWYVLSTPETETITVPSGLTGTIEGYLTQSGTPTPSTPVYPEANPALVGVSTIYRKYGTETETITSLPAQIIGDGQVITSCQISGNMTQEGTPTPSAPIYPEECGDLETTGEHAGQYKLPISCGGTTTSVYLGEQSATRRIKKLVLDGTEDWERYSGLSNTYRLDIRNAAGIASLGICTHFSIVESRDLLVDNTFTCGQNYIYFRTDGLSLSDWTTYLAQQYANGAPVTIWYILAIPETAVVNEPIRKIGDYADTVTATNVPTTGTPENFDVGTTLKPSEVQLTYHGWHEHEDTKYTE